MCGIAGILSYGSGAPDRAALGRMTRALMHRGPDGEGVELLGPCGLGHRRLSIIDLSSAGHQPMATPDGRFWLTYNGEIYNYIELREELSALGVRFRSQTDSEVILEAYRAFGLEAFQRFNGMWALGIWDREERSLVLSRDRFGIKPLYLHQSPQRLIFASEVKAILAADPALAELDPGAVADFLMTPIVGAGGSTYFNRIERLEPATAQVFGLDRTVRRHRYWTFEPTDRAIEVSPAEAAERVRELLTDSVRLRFRSDVPVGTCLSGGLDSSSIVAIAGRILGQTPESFSAIYSDPGFEEEAFVDAMIEELHLTAYKVSPDASDLPEVMERATYYQEEPTAGPGIYSQYHVMRIAAPRVKVLLDGQGGDEVFGGYFPYFANYTDSLIRKALALDLEAARELFVAGPAIRELTGSNPVTARIEQQLKKQARRARGLALRAARAPIAGVPVLHDLARRIRGLVERPQVPGAKALLGPRAQPAGRTPPQLFLTRDPFIDTLWDQLVRSSIPGLLHYEDRNSMAFSIEARVPFLDYRLVEYAFQLPMREKISGARTKVVLREAMRGLLPERVRERRDKKGYPTPLVRWLKQGNHQQWALDLLTSDRVKQRGLVDPQQVQKIWDHHQSGAADHSWRLWQLLTLEIFCRRYLDGPFKAEDTLLQPRSAPPPVANVAIGSA